MTNTRPDGTKRALAWVLFGVLVGSMAGCGGGGGDNGIRPPPPPPSTQYGALAYTVVTGTCGAVGVVTTRNSSRQSAENAARQRCASEGASLGRQLGGVPRLCVVGWFPDCVAAATGSNAGGRCVTTGEHGASLGNAQAAALQECRNDLGFGAQCQVLVSGCASYPAPPPGIWRGSGTGPPPPPPPPPPPSSPVVLGAVVDGCNDGIDIQYRFFQFDSWRNGNTIAGESRSGVWPSGSQVYVTGGFGQQDADRRLGCTAGKGVCYGANHRSATNTGYWGAGIDGDEACQGCCVQCPSSGSVALRRTLTCN